MRKLVTATAIFGLLSTGPAFAAEDMRISVQGHREAHSRASGFGAALRINLGTSRRAEASRGSLSLGPSIALSGRQTIADLGRLGFADDGSVDVRVAGRSLLERPKRLGAQDGAEESKGPSTTGWVAIALGTVLVVGSVGLFIAARSVQDE